jgi:hypothetical protein
LIKQNKQTNKQKPWRGVSVTVLFFGWFHGFGFGPAEATQMQCKHVQAEIKTLRQSEIEFFIT